MNSSTVMLDILLEKGAATITQDGAAITGDISTASGIHTTNMLSGMGNRLMPVLQEIKELVPR